MQLPKGWIKLFGPDPYSIQDCLDGMKKMPSGCVDLILTDPPFNVGIDYGDETNDNMSDADYSEWMFQRIREMERISKPGHPIIIFSGDKKIHPVLDAVSRTDLIFHHFLKWYKPTGQRHLSGWILYNRTELAIILSKGKPDQDLIDRTILYSDTLIYNPTTPATKEHSDHPCTRPTGLYSHIIRGFTKINDIVFDPFLGSGTTLAACRKTQRRGIGFEVSPDWGKTIRDRGMVDQLNAF